ncbi:MAG: hypothetical protein M1830_007111, partial [Pleopsidium flavum]
LLKEYKGREKEVLAGLTGVHKEMEDQQVVAAVGEDIEGKERRSGQKVASAPAEIDDGWGELLETLEDFPYERYGIKVNKR